MLAELEERAPVETALEEEDVRVVLKFHASTRLANGPFAKLRFVPLGEGEDWTYFVLSDRESRELLAALLVDYSQLPESVVAEIDWNHPKSWAEFLDHVDGIELYGPEDRADPTLNDVDFETTGVVDCLLWPSNSQRVSEQRVEAVISLIDGNTEPNSGVNVVAVDPRSDRALVRVAASRRVLDALLSSADVERIRAPIRASVTLGEIASATMPSDLPELANTKIGLIDGVVNLVNPLTGPSTLVSKGFPEGHTFSTVDLHGTAVAGVAVWGDLDSLVTKGELSQPFPIVSARVLDSDQSGNYFLPGIAHLAIENAVRWLATEQDVRIVNLSINAPSPADGPLRDELTVTIDLLARELDLVIVVSAGNRTRLSGGDWLNAFPGYLADPEAKIAAPGDAALAITVGSHATRDVPGGPNAASKVAIAASGQPSPFTRTGPTRGLNKFGTIKPEFTHHGGNWCWDHSMATLDTKEPGTAAVVAIPPQGRRIVGSNTGTSLAAPAVAHEVARIAERYPEAHANLLRALTALSARRVQQPINELNQVYFAGYGQPDADRVLESDRSRVVLTFEGMIPAGRVVVHRLPIPREFVEGVRSRTFRVALAFDPPVRRSRREYVAGTMSVELVRGLTLSDVQQVYGRQPSTSAATEDPTLVRHDLPDEEHRPTLTPGPLALTSGTLIRREFINGRWDPEHGDYFLVVSHNMSPWTSAQKKSYTEQAYALAVEVAEEAGSSINLYAAVRAQLRSRVRIR